MLQILKIIECFATQHILGINNMKFQKIIISIILALICSSCQIIDDMTSPRIEWDGIKDGICHVDKSGGTISIFGTLNSGRIIYTPIETDWYSTDLKYSQTGNGCNNLTLILSIKPNDSGNIRESTIQFSQELTGLNRGFLTIIQDK